MNLMAWLFICRVYEVCGQVLRDPLEIINKSDQKQQLSKKQAAAWKKARHCERIK